MNGLAVCYQLVDRVDLAVPLYEETVRLRKAKLGPDHPGTLQSMHNLALDYQAANRLDLALPLFEETLALKKVRLGPDHRDTLGIMGKLATSYQDAGKLDRAVPLLEETLERSKAKLGPDHFRTLNGMGNLALGYRAGGKLDRALPILVEAASLWKQKAGTNLPRYANALGQLGLVQLESRMWAQAESTLRECLAIQELRQPNNWSAFNTRSVLGGALLGQKRYDAAEPLLRAGYEGMTWRVEKIPLRDKVGLGEALERLITFAEATNRADDAKAWKNEREKLPSNPLRPGTEKR
jgi:tetratricopeptide (TPR) repeat protein